jgi:glutamine synthetase
LGTTLCIPTVLSLTPEALDYKTPLLRLVMDEAATDVCKYFDVKKVTATLGWEQEYF